MKNIIALIFTALLLFSCDSDQKNTALDIKEVLVNEKITSEINAKKGKGSSLIETSNRAINLLKDKNFEEFSSLIHPTLGIRFSPSAFIDVNTDLTFNTTDLNNLITQKHNVVWGTHKGSGESIELDFNSYYSYYIYDADYGNAENITENNCLKNGSVINNITEIYRDSEFVEYYFSGFDKKHEGMDWKAVRLVFKKLENKYCIIGVIHN